MSEAVEAVRIEHVERQWYRRGGVTGERRYDNVIHQARIVTRDCFGDARSQECGYEEKITTR